MKKEINILNVIFCLLVVLIHITSEAVSGLNNESIPFLMVYIPNKLSSFVVYGFIFLSAVKLFSKDTKKIKLLDYYKGRFLKILVPYFIAVLIYYLYFISRGFFEFSIKDLLNYILTGDLVAHFYFIIIITQFYALFPLWRKLFDKVNKYVLLVASLIITFVFNRYLPSIISNAFNGFNFIYNDRIFTTYLFYWVLGALVGMNYKTFTDWIIKHKMLICGSFAIIATTFISFNYLFVRYKYFVSILDILQIIFNISAILFLFYMAIRLSNSEKLIKAITNINSHSYYVYLYHVILIFILNDVLDNVGAYRIDERLVIKFFAVYIVIFALCYIAEKLKLLCSKTKSIEGK